MSPFADLTQSAKDLAHTAAHSVLDLARGHALRLGVTGLSRAGKTVFITALVHDLMALAQADGAAGMPVLRVAAQGRLRGAGLAPQPDDAVPRFAYEEHLAALRGGDDPSARTWPHSTRRVSELRLSVDYVRVSGWRQGPATLHIDIVDYPGEWLLDLPLLTKSYAQWSRETLAASQSAARKHLATDWQACLAGLDPHAPASEETARRAAAVFTTYLQACRADAFSFSCLPPGRFLMPGDLEGSPALTFVPLAVDEGEQPAGSLAAMMARRYDSYKTHVVQPFFRDHFARLDRQIVLVDTLAALNAGPAALQDLETALADILTAFRTGRASLWSHLFRPRIDRILFAATKADHLHHTSHDALEAILRRLTAKALARAQDVGARVDVVALAAVRATREGSVKDHGATLNTIIGTPQTGEKIGDETFDGSQEAAIFPGLLTGDARATHPACRFVRFRPPVVTADPAKPLPHIRLDRALQFLLGDRLA